MRKNLPVDIWFRPCTRSSAFSQSLADSILAFAEIKLASDLELCWLCWSAFLVTCADCCRPPKTLSEWLQTRRVHHPNWSGIVLALPIASTCLSAPSPVETLPRFQVTFTPAWDLFLWSGRCGGFLRVWNIEIGLTTSSQFNEEAPACLCKRRSRENVFSSYYNLCWKVVRFSQIGLENI